MIDGEQQAELLAAYQAALRRDRGTAPPDGLDRSIAALARRVADLPHGDDPDPAFVAALADRLALATPYGRRVMSDGQDGQESLRTSLAQGQPVSPRKRRWVGAPAWLRVAASIAIVFAIGILLALILSGRDASSGTAQQPPTATAPLAGLPAAPSTPSPTARATTTSCTGTLAPQQPATPPARPIPATPTGNEADLYIPCYFERDPGLARAEQLGLVQFPNLTQAGPGGTVTIERFYADTNRIVVAYTITRTADAGGDKRFPPIRPVLADGEGRSYRYTSPGGFGAFGGEKNGQAFSRSVISFEATPLPPDARQEQFRLTFDPAEITNVPPPPYPFGPWIVDLTMPIVPARTATVGQAVTSPVASSYQRGSDGAAITGCDGCPVAPSEGVAITVERVVVTVSETRIYLRLAAPPIARSSGWEVRGIAVEEPGSPSVQQGGTTPQADGTVMVSLVNPLYQKRGEWTLSIHELWGLVFAQSASGPSNPVQVRLTGEWIYHFTLP